MKTDNLTLSEVERVKLQVDTSIGENWAEL